MALPEPIKRGQVHPKDYQNEDYYGKLQPLVAALAEEVPDAKYDAKSLVYQLVQILHFQEAALGRDAMPPRIMPKLPIRLITDPSVDGALHAIALKLHDIKRVRGLKAIEWQNPGKRKECLEVLVTLRRELERRQLLVVPLVHVSPSLGPETQRLREYVRRLQGNLAEGPDEAGVTHLVYPFGPAGDPDDGQEYRTVVAVKGERARVHYWYQPDSYDEWVPLDTLENKEVDPTADKAPPGGKWKVTPRWVVDSEKFNEWMNPADYTTPEGEAEMEAAAGGKEAGKRAGGALGGPAKKAKTDASRPEVAAEPLSVLDVHVATRQLLAPHKGLADPPRTITVENISQGQTNVHMAAYLPPVPPQAPRQAPAAGGTTAAAGSSGEHAAGDNTGSESAGAAGAAAAADGGGAAADDDRALINLSAPAFASWFKWETIHDIERSSVPDFFNGRSSSKTPQLYRHYRDTMVRLYLADPSKPLSFATVKQKLDGEVNGLMRIYELLAHWGVINHAKDVHLSEATLARRLRMQQHLPVGGNVSTRMPPGTACLFDFQCTSRSEGSAAAQAGGLFHAASSSGGGRAGAAGGAPGSLLMPAYGRSCSDVGLHPSVTSRIFCSAMPWQECTRLRYHCTRYPDINLCPQAYAEGRFPPGTSSRDFVRVDAASRGPSADGWRPEETLLLLEGLEMYKEDWAAIAAHVGTRSQAACLMHFVRLPIEDQFVEDIADWGGGGSAAGGGTATVRPSQDGATTAAAGAAAAAGGADGGAVAVAAVPGVPDGLVLPFQEDQNPCMSVTCLLAVLMGPRVAAAAAQRALQVIVEGDTAAGQDLQVAARIAAGPPQAGQGGAGEGGVAGMEGVEGAAGAGAGDVDPSLLDPARPVPRPLVLAATAAGLSAAAVKAKLLADAEEREIQRLMVALVDGQQRKVDSKTKLLADMTQVVERERVAAETSIKQQLVEYAQLVEQRKKAEAAKAVQQQAVAKHKAALAQQKAAAAAQQQQQQQKQQQAAAAAQKQQQQQQGAVAGQPNQGQPPQVKQEQQAAPQQPQQQQKQQQQVPGQPAAAAGAMGLGQQPGMQPGAGAQQQFHQQFQRPPQPQPMEEDDDDFDMP